MALCSICKVVLPIGDNHSSCLMHRKCSRLAPCTLDFHQPAEYWDDMEARLIAAQESPRKSARISKTKKVTKSSNVLPALAPLKATSIVKSTSKVKKIDGSKKSMSSVATLPLQSTDKSARLAGTKSSGVSNSGPAKTSAVHASLDSSKSGHESDLEMVEMVQNRKKRKDNQGIPDTLTKTSDPTYTLCQKSSTYENPSMDDEVREVPNVTRKCPQNDRNMTNTTEYDYGQATVYESTDQVDYRSPLPPSLAGGFGSQLRHNTPRQATNTMSRPVIDKQPLSTESIHGMVNQPQQQQWISPAREAPVTANQWCLPQLGSQSAQPYGFMNNLLMMNQMLLNSMGQPFVNQPQGANVGVRIGLDHPQIVTRQPTAPSTATSFTEEEVDQEGGEIPVVDTDPIQGNIPQRRYMPLNTPMAGTLDSAAVNPFLQPSTSRDRGFGRDEGWDDFEEEDATGPKLSDIFAKTRVDPVLKASAELLGLESLEDDQETDVASLKYGNLGPLPDSNSPLIKMPNEVAFVTKYTRKTKRWRPRPPMIFNRVFRVSQDNYEKFFAVPKMEGDVSAVFKRVPSKLTSYSPFWDTELSSLDENMKMMERLSAFQLSIMNGLIVELQPVESEDGQEYVQDNTAMAIPMARLATDITAQLLKSSIRLSHRMTKLRRTNVCAGLKGKYIESLVDDLMDLSFDDSPMKLFGGRFTKTIDKTSKHKISEEALEKVRLPNPSFQAGEESGGSTFRSSSGRFGARGMPRGQYGRGLKRKAQYQPRGRGSAPFKRGRGGWNRGRGRGQRF